MSEHQNENEKDLKENFNQKSDWFDDMDLPTKMIVMPFFIVGGLTIGAILLSTWALTGQLLDGEESQASMSDYKHE